MTIPFANIPSNLRVPLFYAEIDPSRANTAAETQRTLIIGQMTAAGSAAPNVPVRCTGDAAIRQLAGAGSALALMAAAYRLNDPAGEMWLLPLQDDPDAVAQVRTVTITGAPSANGTVWFYVNDVAVPFMVTAGMTLPQVAAALLQAIQANPDLPVTASIDGGSPTVVTFTAKNKGASVAVLKLNLNLLGSAAGQSPVPGYAQVAAIVTPGSGAPVLTTALANLGEVGFDFIVTSLNEAAAVSAVSALLSDTNGRWSWQQQRYGHAFACFSGTSGQLATYGAALNDQHLTVVGAPSSMNSPSYAIAAAFAGAAAASLRQDPGLPLQSIQVQGLLAPAISGRFSLTTRNTLLYDGISTFTVVADGSIAIENLITTYQQNAAGQADNSYLEVETMFLLMYVLRFMRAVVQTKYARVKLAADGTRVLPGSNVVTPSTIKADLIAAYRELEADGMVQRSDLFAANLVVEKDAQNPNRVNVLWPGTLINQLRVFALLAQFRLN